jgi:hypothetical protein
MAGAKKAKARAAELVVKVDPIMKRTYAALTKIIEKTTAQEKKDFDARWEAAGIIVEQELFRVGGFASADDFYRRFMHEEPRVAQRFVRVARYASPDEEVSYGIYKLDAAIGFIEAKLGHPLAHPPLPVAFDKLRIPVGAKKKSLEHATITEINAATSKLTARGRKRTKSTAHAAFEKAIARVTSLEGVHVHERDGFVSFQRIPVAAIHHFLGALTHAAAKMR